MATVEFVFGNLPQRIRNESIHPRDAFVRPLRWLYCTLGSTTHPEAQDAKQPNALGVLLCRLLFPCRYVPYAVSPFFECFDISDGNSCAGARDGTVLT